MTHPLPNLGNLLTGQLVRLAAIQIDDYKQLERWQLDVEFLRLMDTNPAVPRSLVAITRHEKERMDRHSGHRFEFMFRTLDDNKTIGFGGLGLNWNHRNAWLDIGIGDSAYRSRGYGTDGMRLLVGFGFRELDLHRITLSVFANNARAIRCYQKVGFVHEVTQRAKAYRDGQRMDTHVMGLLRSEWEAQQVSI